MGDSYFTPGDWVKIQSGSFAGVEGQVARTDSARVNATVLLAGTSLAKPVAVETTIDGRRITLQVPRDLLVHVTSERD